MKLLYDHQFFPILPYSGISRYFYELISRVSCQAGVEASLYMGWHNNKYPFGSLRMRLKHYFSQPRPRLPRTARFFNGLSGAGLRLFAARWRPDLYHQTFYWYHLPRFKGKRVLTLYDMIYFIYPQYDTVSSPIRDCMAKSIKHSAGIVAISECTKRDVIRFLDVSEEKVRVIHLANSLNALPSPESPVGNPYILFVGQRFHWKNFAFLLDAYCETPRLHKNFRLVCFGGRDLSGEEKGVLARHNLPDDRLMRFSGSDELLATLYSHAALLVYPSLYEGFGLPILEAMHCGCPVLASDRSSIPEVGGEAAVYFSPESRDDLLSKLDRCLSDGELRARLTKAGLAREKQFSWDKCADDTLTFYRELVGG